MRSRYRESFLPLVNLFMANLSRNHIENKFSILEIYLQCDFIHHLHVIRRLGGPEQKSAPPRPAPIPKIV